MPNILPRFPEWNWNRIWFTGTILAGAALYFNPYTFQYCLTTDEGFSWRVASQESPAQVIQMTGGDVHPPFYYLCLWAWIKLWGTSEFALRGLSGLFSLGTVLATYWYAKIWIGDSDSGHSRSGALLAATLVTLSLAQIGIASTARMYALMTLLTVLSSGALLLAMGRPKVWKWWWAYALTAAGMVYTHNYGLFVVTGQGLWVLGEFALGPSRRARFPKLWGAFSAFCLVGILYAPWVPWLRWQMKQVAADYWIPSLSWPSVGALAVQAVSLPFNHMPPLSWYEILFLGLFTVAILWPWRGALGERHLGCVILVHAAAIGIAYYYLGRSLFVPRFVVYLVPLFFVPLAYWLCRIPDRLLRGITIGWVIFSMVFAIVTVTLDLGLFSPFQSGLRRSVNTLLQESAPGDPVIVTNKDWYLLFQYYLSREQPGQPCWVYDQLLTLAKDQHVVFASGILPEEVWHLNDFKNLQGQRFWVVGPPGFGNPDWVLLWEGVFRDSAIGGGGLISVASYRIDPEK